jgi:hypothetical protein
VEELDPRLFIYAGTILAIIGFFFIHPYQPDLGPLENAMIGTIPLGNSRLPYRFVLVAATVMIGYALYRLWVPRHPDRRR